MLDVLHHEIIGPYAAERYDTFSWLNLAILASVGTINQGK
jgi:hypothetical protein